MLFRSGVYTFYNHEIEGEKLTKLILKRLKSSNEEIKVISHLVRHHMFNYTTDWSDSAVRRFINRVGLEYIPLLFQLRIADQIAIAGKPDFTSLEELEARIERIKQEQCALTLSALKLDGNQLIALGIPKGKLIGQILNYLLEQVIEDPSLNESDKLTTLALSYYKALC